MLKCSEMVTGRGGVGGGGGEGRCGGWGGSDGETIHEFKSVTIVIN